MAIAGPEFVSIASPLVADFDSGVFVLLDSGRPKDSLAFAEELLFSRHLIQCSNNFHFSGHVLYNC